MLQTLKNFSRIVRRNAFAMSNKKIPPPQNPTMTESFGMKVSEEEMQVLLDPRGFLNEEEKVIADAPIDTAAKDQQ